MFRSSHCCATGLGAMFAAGLSFSAVAAPPDSNTATPPLCSPWELAIARSLDSPQTKKPETCSPAAPYTNQYGIIYPGGPAVGGSSLQVGFADAYDSSNSKFEIHSVSRLKTSETANFVSLNGTYRLPNGIFFDGNAAFAPVFGGSFSEKIPHVPGVLDSGSVNGYSLYSGTINGGANLFQWNNVNAGVFAGFNAYRENLSGTFSTGTNASVLQETWYQARTGAYAQVALPYGIYWNVAGYYAPWVEAQTTGFEGTGTGWGGSTSLSFALPDHPGFFVNVFGQFVDMCAEGTLFGMKVSTSNSNYIGGIGLHYNFGGGAATGSLTPMTPLY